jgi:hypothetical protein
MDRQRRFIIRRLRRMVSRRCGMAQRAVRARKWHESPAWQQTFFEARWDRARRIAWRAPIRGVRA